MYAPVKRKHNAGNGGRKKYDGKVTQCKACSGSDGRIGAHHLDLQGPGLYARPREDPRGVQMAGGRHQ